MLGEILTAVFLTLLLVCAVAVAFVRNVLWAVIIFGAYSLIMTLVWQQLNAPDIAITEAAAGVGMTSIMVAVIIKTGRDQT